MLRAALDRADLFMSRQLMQPPIHWREKWRIEQVEVILTTAFGQADPMLLFRIQNAMNDPERADFKLLAPTAKHPSPVP